MVEKILKNCIKCGEMRSIPEDMVKWKCPKCDSWNKITEWTKFEKMKIDERLVDHVDEIWRNNRYEVHLQFMDKEKGINGFIWLQLKDVNKEAIHDWREMQRIKNEICGDEREAVELFPAESRMVDTSNQFHLFVLPLGKKCEFGYKGRAIVKGHDDFVEGAGGSKQRAFEVNPSDALTIEEAKELAKGVLK